MEILFISSALGVFAGIMTFFIKTNIEDMPLTWCERNKINIPEASTFWAYHEQRYRKKRRISPLHIDLWCDVSGFESASKKFEKAFIEAYSIPGFIVGKAKNDVRSGDMVDAMMYGYRAGKTIKAKRDLWAGDVLTMGNDGVVDALRHYDVRKANIFNEGFKPKEKKVDGLKKIYYNTRDSITLCPFGLWAPSKPGRIIVHSDDCVNCDYYRLRDIEENAIYCEHPDCNQKNEDKEMSYCKTAAEVCCGIKPKEKTMGIKLEDLRPEDAGRPFVCDIVQTQVNGHLQYEGGKFYLCQDRWDGVDCSNRFGYKKSWGWHDNDSDIENFRFTDEQKWSDGILEGIRKYFSFFDHSKQNTCPAGHIDYRGRCVSFCEEVFKPMGFKKTDESDCPCRVYGKETVEARFNVIIKEAGPGKKKVEKKKEEKTYRRGGVWRSVTGVLCILSSVSSGNVKKMNFICSDGDCWSGTFVVDDFMKIRKSEIPTDSLFYTGFDSIEDYYRDKFGNHDCQNEECRDYDADCFGNCADNEDRKETRTCSNFKAKG